MNDKVAGCPRLCGSEWTGRGCVAVVSNKGDADGPVRHGHRSACQQNSFDTCETCVWSPCGSVDIIHHSIHAQERHSPAPCSSSQSSSRPAYSCRVVTRSEYAHHAHGASRLAVRRPRRGGKARLLPQPALSLERPFRDMCDLQRTASSSGRVRDIADQRHYFRNGAHETLFVRLMMVECT